MLRAARFVIAMLAVAATLTACTGHPAPTAASSGPTPGTTATVVAKPSAAASPTISQPAVTTAWTYDDQRPMTRFEAVDGALVGMTLRDKLLRITALDPATGRVLWDQPASPGYNPPGVYPEVLVMGHKVIYLEPVSSKFHFWTFVVVADARTGRMLASSSDDYEIDGLPEQCGKSVCFDGYKDLTGETSPEESWVLNPLTGTVRSDSGNKEVAGGDWRAIGDGGLIEIGSGKNREIGRAVKGKVLWHRRWSDFFGPDFTSDSGWQWDYDAKNHIFTGEIGWAPADIRKRTEHLTTSSIMIGLDSRTGKLRWRTVGVTRWCDALWPITELPRSDEDFRCRYRSGTRSYRKDVKTWLKDVGETVEHFDHVSNRVIWSVALDPYSVSDDYAEPRVRILDDNHLLGWQHKHVIAFDLRDGSVTTVPATTVGWCATSDDVPYGAEPFKGAGKDRVTATLLMACGSDGKQTKITTMPPKSLSATIDGMRVVTGLHAVTGLRPV